MIVLFVEGAEGLMLEGRLVCSFSTHSRQTSTVSAGVIETIARPSSRGEAVDDE